MNEQSKRIQEFKDEINEQHLGAPSADNERIVLIVGIVLMALGVVFIVAGWWGASGEGTIVEQFPYLISGGVLGLASITAGSVLFARYSMTRFMRYWLIRVIYEQQAQTDRIVEGLNRIENASSRKPVKKKPSPPPADY
jgi:hypothetical protein